MSILDKKESVDDALNWRIRITVLVLLCCQNAGHALLTRYSQGVLKEHYSSTEVVMVGEVIKLAVSGYLSITDNTETDAKGIGLYKLWWLIRHCSNIIVLVVLYALANLLTYYALARVDASVYTVLIQLKILTTAGFSVLLRNKVVTPIQWRALLLLVVGCVLVASSAYNQPVDCSIEQTTLSSGKIVDSSQEYSAMSASGMQTLLGIGAVITMVILSGYSAVYFESLLKSGEKGVTIWERNFQLSFCSVWLLIAIIIYEQSTGEDDGLPVFAGWTINTVMITLISAVGGLLVAACLKYADAILKTLACSGAIVLTAVLGFLLLDGQLDIIVGLGCVCAILAITNYNF